MNGKTIIWSSDEDGAKVLHSPESGKDLQQDPQVLVQKKSGLPRFALVPEDVPIDFGVIATRIKVAPYCGVIYAALQPLREVLEIAAFLAKVLGDPNR